MTKSILQPGVSPLDGQDARTLLEKVVTSVREQAPRSIVCFDLDSTLLNNAPRQARIMREYGANHGVEALTTVQGEHWEGWDAKIPMRAVGLNDDELAKHFDAFREYWRECFFSSDYCNDDQAISGAPEYVISVLSAGARVLYLTGRHEPMRDGTVTSFKTNNFPLPDGDRVQLIMKPTLEEHDDEYKLQTYEKVREMGTVVAAFDNEPIHVNGYKTAFPEALSVHMATDHSMRDVLVLPGIPSIKSFASWL